MNMTESPPREPAATADLTLREFIRVFGLLERVMQPYFAQFGISGSHWGVLRNLHRAEQEGLPGLRLTDLSERLLIRPPSVTGVVDRLERAGLVNRGGSTIDLRSKMVSLSPEGRQLMARILGGHGRHIERVMAGLNEDERETLHALLERLGNHLASLLAHKI